MSENEKLENRGIKGNKKNKLATITLILIALVPSITFGYLYAEEKGTNHEATHNTYNYSTFMVGNNSGTYWCKTFSNLTVLKGEFNGYYNLSLENKTILNCYMVRPHAVLPTSLNLYINYYPNLLFVDNVSSAWEFGGISGETNMRWFSIVPYGTLDDVIMPKGNGMWIQFGFQGRSDMFEDSVAVDVVISYTVY